MLTIIDSESSTSIDDIHTLFPVEDRHIVDSIIQRLLSQCCSLLGTDEILSLSDLHNHVTVGEINSLRMQLFSFLNSNDFDWADLVHSLAGNQIAQALGPDYLIQSKINLSIQMPFDESSVLPIHSDCVSGDSPWQLNFWLPLTNAFNSSSMFLVSRIDTIDYLKALLNLSHSASASSYTAALNRASQFHKHFISIAPGYALLFHPGVLHGNELNVESFTRLSLNIRVKSIFTPESKDSNADRQFGTYYQLGRFSSASRFSQDLSSLFNNNAV